MPSCEPSRSPGAAPICVRGAEASTSDGPIGELWFDAPRSRRARDALLLKLLFTTEPLSIQVHPDDAFARSIGLANGKTEAWYILSAVAGREGRGRTELSAFRRRTANRHHGRLDRQHRALAPGSSRRRRLYSCRNHSRDRRRHRSRRNPAAQRRHVPAVRLWTATGTAHRKCRRRGDAGAPRSPIASRAIERRANGPHRQSTFCSGTDRS